MRHVENLTPYLKFKTSSKLFEQANKAINELIKRATQNLAKRGKTSIDDPAKVKALCKQAIVVYAWAIRSPYNAIYYRRQIFARWAHSGAPFVFFTINPQEIRSSFCWKLCNADFSP
jgi:hypothetical protein